MYSNAIIVGRSNSDLGEKIAHNLAVPIIDCKISDFANGEISVEFSSPENVKQKNIFVVQTSISSQGKSPQDYYVECLQIADACYRLCASSVSLIYAHLPYGRSDKKESNKPSIMASVIFNGLQAVGYKKILSLDLHSQQLEGMSSLLIDNIDTSSIFIDCLKQLHLKEDEQYVLVTPDLGGCKRIKYYANKLNLPYAIMDKERDYSKNNTVINNKLIYGSVANKKVIIIDDIADSMGTLLSAISCLQSLGATEIIIVVTHGIFSGKAIDIINNTDCLTTVITTNSIDQTHNKNICSKIQVLDSSNLFASRIK